uniref:histidine kinase n=1 Tax=Dechloromonas aromatica (strain RCB) TaxID=159087 RepID=Q47I70_DECAR
MGRLFWKLFLFIWLGQMAAVIGTGALFWVERNAHPAHMEGGGGHPPPPFSEKFEHHAPPADSLDRPSDSMGRPPARHEPPGIRFPIAPILAGLLASVLCAAGLAWYFAMPIRQLRQGFDAAANGELDVRVGPGMGQRRDELADLGRDFDRMTERLQSVVEGQKRLLHDVSHEMRSPLARLQAAVGLARQQPERMEDFLARVERESERMNRLVGELLTLSRLEAGSAGALSPVDMEELLAQLVEDARFEGAARQVVIDYVPGKMAEVLADTELLHRAIENVVRNALRFSPPGGVVRIEAETQNDGVFHIRVLDQGPGVAEADLEAIFTPFYRGAAPRDDDGYGLGLAIARRVVQVGNGTIRASNVTGAGLLVSIELPIVIFL